MEAKVQEFEMDSKKNIQFLIQEK